MIQAIRFPNQPTKVNQGGQASLIDETNFNPDFINEVRVDHIEYVTNEIQKDWHRYWAAYVRGDACTKDLVEFKQVFEKHCMIEQKLEQSRRKAKHEAKTKPPSETELKRQRDKLLDDFYKYGQ